MQYTADPHGLTDQTVITIYDRRGQVTKSHALKGRIEPPFKP
jgi:hypothetical protein